MNIKESNLMIISQLAEGLPLKRIASNLGMKKRTVESRIEKLKAEYEASNIAQLVVKAMLKNLHYFAEAPKYQEKTGKEEAGKETDF